MHLVVGSYARTDAAGSAGISHLVPAVGHDAGVVRVPDVQAVCWVVHPSIVPVEAGHLLRGQQGNLCVRPHAHPHIPHLDALVLAVADEVPAPTGAHTGARAHARVIMRASPQECMYVRMLALGCACVKRVCGNGATRGELQGWLRHRRMKGCSESPGF